MLHRDNLIYVSRNFIRTYNAAVLHPNSCNDFWGAYFCVAFFYVFCYNQQYKPQGAGVRICPPVYICPLRAPRQEEGGDAHKLRFGRLFHSVCNNRRRRLRALLSAAQALAVCKKTCGAHTHGAKYRTACVKAVCLAALLGQLLSRPHQRRLQHVLGAHNNKPLRAALKEQGVKAVHNLCGHGGGACYLHSALLVHRPDLLSVGRAALLFLPRAAHINVAAARCLGAV